MTCSLPCSVRVQQCSVVCVWRNKIAEVEGDPEKYFDGVGPPIQRESASGRVLGTCESIEQGRCADRPSVGSSWIVFCGVIVYCAQQLLDDIATALCCCRACSRFRTASCATGATVLQYRLHMPPWSVSRETLRRLFGGQRFYVGSSSPYPFLLQLRAL